LDHFAWGRASGRAARGLEAGKTFGQATKSRKRSKKQVGIDGDSCGRLFTRGGVGKHVGVGKVLINS
jgi:hypothetical protein